ncbi:hypothetical protein UFOVP908_220 [uncultured Caudovirales phage]|uniref:Uncharacterized protein n=1 Tax=uncultured Caudovirales phage TaxID=2100421 RepID=A0A6J5Q6D4_9CAUD|nr:hypothetical protein UFOVP908_220 [uncultured Caudovirales phage]CAB4177041.1 hypothetical protein UFOVP990_149 [uncultured Caudovirales phage]CAB4182227.1 hypothetical protein UFOVP1065_180 [uncultured Caudovirales phage]CAB4190809.1 hypothetical protein UFOVP1198_149 [uncultured Caudovirales phage]CAB4211158.1 hypothetical protein UFOVP1418_141 [uncultured Caudovirales phage]
MDQRKTMEHSFFSKDPAKTLEEVKAHLYSRLDSVRQTAVEQNRHGDSGSMGRRDTLMNEAAFLAVLLDKLERS